jgi:RimJ/RimL family protein N-acetyltransferase
MQATYLDQATDLASLGVQLEAADWEVRLLARLLPTLCRQAGELAPDARLTWVIGLRRAWNHHGWALSGDARRALLELAAAWCDWPLAREVGEQCQERGELDADAARLLLAAWFRSGELDAALALAVHGQLACPHDARYAIAYRALLDSQALRQRFSCIEGEEWGEPGLRLEPLGHQHRVEFAWLYHDPDIAELCNLPDFADNAEWHDWLDDCRESGDQVVYAVLDRQWGFVGSVSLILHEGVGYFYYWLGRAFRGQRLGPRAGALLLRYAEANWGLRACYAKVYAHNAGSRRALARLSFRELDVASEMSGAPVRFYRRGAPATAADSHAELAWLLGRMGSSCIPRTIAVVTGRDDFGSR